MKNPFPDQNEVVAECARLELRARSLRAELQNKTGQPVAAPALPKDDFLQVVEMLEAHVTDLEAKLATGAKPASAAAIATKKQTLTERVLAAQGVQTFTELNAKKARKHGSDD